MRQSGIEKHGRATCRETCTCGSGRGPRYIVLICVGPRNSSEIVMAQKQIWSDIPLFPVLVMFFISCLAETNRAPFDLPEAEAESVVGYNVEYTQDAILNSSLLVEANVPASRGLILTETKVDILPFKAGIRMGSRDIPIFQLSSSSKDSSIIQSPLLLLSSTPMLLLSSSMPMPPGMDPISCPFLESLIHMLCYDGFG
ncbi:unnamed protein product [Lactuca saligna]|uniref:NADH-ubiquinone oxidoreductase chain 1 n=1 Tax=Lactuca saligna TaxID=75948 RepID=A0AA35V9D5_LACSI|nr:unnamed protein product [Lactuca saligna]